MTPAFAQDIGAAGGGNMDYIVLISAALTVGVMYLLIIRPLQRRVRLNPDLVLGAPVVPQSQQAKASAAAPESDSKPTSSDAGDAPVEDGTEIQSLMSAVRDQAVELRGAHAKVASDLSFKFDVLTNRLSTIEPLLAKAMETARRSEATAGLLTVSNDEYRRKLAQTESDLSFYRPLAAKLEDEIRIARNHVAETDRKFAALEGDYAKTQGACNEMFQKMASAEVARQRAAEENVAFAQKLSEHDFTIQSLLRETARFKSEAVSIGSDLERAEAEAKSLAEKYATELEGNCKATAALTSLQAEFVQFKKDSAAQIAQVVEREKVLIEAFSIKEKQFYDSEIKRSALDSKIDFLTRTNQRLREDLRGHLDHIGNLESSNRRLLDLLARNSAAEEIEAKEAAAARAAPKLRAVPDSQTAGSPAKPVPADRA